METKVDKNSKNDAELRDVCTAKNSYPSEH
jgi:hypothetical protein